MRTVDPAGGAAAGFGLSIFFLAMMAVGIVGMVYILVTWTSDGQWIGWLGLVTTIPASLYGAHLAKKHLPQEM